MKSITISKDSIRKSDDLYSLFYSSGIPVVPSESHGVNFFQFDPNYQIEMEHRGGNIIYRWAEA